MKIVLLYPQFTDIYGNYKPAAQVGVAYPPLGLMYLASSLERDNHDVTIIDSEIEGLSKKDVARIIRVLKPDVVGITSTTPIHHKAMELFKVIKNVDASITTIAGGPHPTAIPEQTLKDSPEIDVVVIGEAEETIREFCKGKNYSEIDGICFRYKGRIKVTKKRKLIANIDSLPLPARHLIKNEKYLWSVPKKGIMPVSPIMTVRGCPYKCVFCSQFVTFGYCTRYRSVENIIKEIDAVSYTHLTLPTTPYV